MDIADNVARAEDAQDAQKLTASAVLRAARDAAGAAGDASGNCDAAVHYAVRRQFAQAAQEMAQAEDNARAAMHRIQAARATIASAVGAAA